MIRPHRAGPASALILLAGLAAGAGAQSYPEKIAAAIKTIAAAAERGPVPARLGVAGNPNRAGMVP